MLGRKEQVRGSKSDGREKEPIVDEVGKPRVLVTLKQRAEGQGRGGDLLRERSQSRQGLPDRVSMVHLRKKILNECPTGESPKKLPPSGLKQHTFIPLSLGKTNSGLLEPKSRCGQDYIPLWGQRESIGSPAFSNFWGPPAPWLVAPSSTFTTSKGRCLSCVMSTHSLPLFHLEEPL